MTCVVILHGRGESIPHGLAHGFADDLRSVLQRKNMTNYSVIEVGLSNDTDLDYNWSSYKPMDFQMEKLCQYINQNVMIQLEQNCTRIQLVGCSQGALLLRGLLWDKCLDSLVPKIEKLITFGGPNNGIFGVPSCNELSSDNQLIVIGCRLLQETIKTTGPSVLDPFVFGSTAVLSFASYWNSPGNRLTNITFLADINNQNTRNGTKYLSQKIKGLVLISFGSDQTVLPNISAFFGYWDIRAKNIIPYNQTNIYKRDSFGLKTLDENNLITFNTIANSSHMNIPLDFIENQFLTYI